LKDASKKKSRLVFSGKGFTLLEVMIAVAIVSGVVVTIITSLNFHLSVVDRESGKLTATLLARQKYEETRLLGPPVAGTKEGKFSDAFEGFSWKYRSADSFLPGVKKVLVTVSWGEGESVDIESYEEGL
jgi:general secretion pathway protein I